MATKEEMRKFAMKIESLVANTDYTYLEAIVEHLPEFSFDRHDRMINFIFETSATAEVEVDKVCGTLISDWTVVVSLFDLEVSSSPHFFIN